MKEDGTFEIRMLEADAYKEGTYKVVVTATPEEGEAVTKESEEVKVVKEQIDEAEEKLKAIKDATNQFQLKDALEKAGIEFDEKDLPKIEKTLEAEELKTLEDVQKAIDALEEKAEFETLKKEIEAAKGNDAKLIAALEKASDEVNKDNVKDYGDTLFDGEGLKAKDKKELAEDIKTVNAKVAVEALTEDGVLAEGVNQGKIDAAKALVEKLDDENEKKSELEGKVKKAQDLLDAAEEAAEARAEAVKKAEKAIEEYKAAGGKTDSEEANDPYKSLVDIIADETKTAEQIDTARKALEEKTKELAAVDSVDAEIVTKIEDVESTKTVKAGTVLEVKLTARKKAEATKATVKKAEETQNEGEKEEAPETPEAEVQDKYNETIARIDVKHGDNTIVLRNVVFEKGIATVEVKLEKVQSEAKELNFGTIADVTTEVKTEVVKVVAGDLTVMEGKAKDLTEVTITGQDDYKNAKDLEKANVVDATIDGEDIFLGNINKEESADSKTAEPKTLTISDLKLEAEKEYTIKLVYKAKDSEETKTFEITFKTPKAAVIEA